MKQIITKHKAYIILLPIIIIAAIVIINISNQTEDPIVAFETMPEEIKEESKTEKIQTLKVDLKGEVQTPGVYELEIGKRVDDAIKLGGGLTENADTTLINLSKNLKDEMVIVVYNKNEIEKLRQDLKTTKTVIEYIEKECTCPDTVNDACITKNNSNDITSTTEQQNTEKSNKININTATKQELMTVSGIGETKADAIIKYRNEKGIFNDINEITNVSGIGTSTFEKIKDYITV